MWFYCENHSRCPLRRCTAIAFCCAVIALAFRKLLFCPLNYDRRVARPEGETLIP